MGIGSCNDDIALDGSVSNLGGDVFVTEPDHKPVLGGVVLVLVLIRQSTAPLVVCLALPAPPKLHLVAAEVRAGLHNLMLTHLAASYTRRKGKGSNPRGMLAFKLTNMCCRNMQLHTCHVALGVAALGMLFEAAKWCS